MESGVVRSERVKEREIFALGARLYDPYHCFDIEVSGAVSRKQSLVLRAKWI